MQVGSEQPSSRAAMERCQTFHRRAGDEPSAARRIPKHSARKKKRLVCQQTDDCQHCLRRRGNSGRVCGPEPPGGQVQPKALGRSGHEAASPLIEQRDPVTCRPWNSTCCHCPAWGRLRPTRRGPPPGDRPPPAPESSWSPPRPVPTPPPTDAPALGSRASPRLAPARP